MARGSSDGGVFHAIACPTRRALIDALAFGEKNVSDLVASLEVTQSAVSQQLGVLKAAGFVEERAQGRFRYYSLRAEPLAELEGWMGRYRACIERQLDALGRVLDARSDEPPERARRAQSKRQRHRRTSAHAGVADRP